MSVVVVAPPLPIVSLAEAKLQLWIDADDPSKDAMITPMIAAATAYLDGPAGWLGRALGLQTLEWRGRSFSSHRNFLADWDRAFGLRPGWDYPACGDGRDSLVLPFPPVVAVQSVAYRDAAGTWQKLDPSATALDENRLRPSVGTTWPDLAHEAPDTVRVRYQAGYPDADGNPLPAPVKQAILMMVSALYDSRDATPNLAGAAGALLAPYRVVA